MMGVDEIGGAERKGQSRRHGMRGVAMKQGPAAQRMDRQSSIAALALLCSEGQQDALHVRRQRP
jgi:hypothetical protein